jgi:hypothetical protein
MGIRLVGDIARMKQKGTGYKASIGKPEEKPLGNT